MELLFFEHYFSDVMQRQTYLISHKTFFEYCHHTVISFSFTLYTMLCVLLLPLLLFFLLFYATVYVCDDLQPSIPVYIYIFILQRVKTFFFFFSQFISCYNMILCKFFPHCLLLLRVFFNFSFSTCKAYAPWLAGMKMKKKKRHK